MDGEKILRPETARVKAMIAEATRIDTGLLAMQNSEAEQRRAAQLAAQALYDHRLRTALEEMEIEHINRGKQGLRVGLLRDRGIENVLQLSQKNYRQLCAIPGLGEQSAKKITETVKGIVENTKATLRIRIRMENPDPVEDALIRALYIRIHGRLLRDAGKALYKANHKPLQQELVWARKALGGFGWLFRSKAAKRQAVEAVQSLRARLSGEFGEALTAWEEMQTVSPDTYWSDYKINAPVYYTELEKLGLDWEKQETSVGLPAELAAEIEAQPLDLRHLKATLRSYQTFGVKYIVHQKRTLLGDEMGLGKTVQAIAAMAALAAEGKSHFAVVCPASVLINWCREVKKFSDLEVTKVHGNDEEALLHWRENGGVMVTTFESISRFSIPEKFKISMVVTDEAHYVKNPDTQRTRALLKLLKQTEYVLFMSGTPLENRVEEMCFLVS
ncbi:MAG: DEAD/DEAH box helicase family protein, partial [Clostridia bacterium]|nr:DEAD/DEAH box helicase family protein [Clostridia bacterium]